MSAPTNEDCPGCGEPIEGAGYDPGCNYGCGWVMYNGTRTCHERYCSEDCLCNASERAYERELSDYYGGSGPVTLAEQADAAWRLK